jgi:hypothetical protein
MSRAPQLTTIADRAALLLQRKNNENFEEQMLQLVRTLPKASDYAGQRTWHLYPLQ